MNPFEAMYQSGIVPVIVVSDPAKAVNAARAMYRGGTKVVEIAMRLPGAAECIRAVREQCPEIAVGAGTLLTCAQVDEAVAAGAMFGVAPGYDEEIVAYCQSKGLPFVPGTINPSDIQKGIKAGLDVIKFFPSEPMGGLRSIRALSGPYSMVRFLASSGIEAHNLEEYLACPAVHSCAVDFVCNDAHLAAEDWDEVTRLCAWATGIAKKYHG